MISLLYIRGERADMVLGKETNEERRLKRFDLIISTGQICCTFVANAFRILCQHETRQEIARDSNDKH